MSRIGHSERIKIEHYLNEGYTFRQIAKFLKVNPSTISREVNRNIRNIKPRTYNDKVECVYRDNCPRLVNSTKSKMCSIYCPDYILKTCKKFITKNSKPVCNKCPKYNHCSLAKKKYDARVAENKYAFRIDSRPKVRITSEQFEFLNELFSSLMSKGQSISVIYENHKDEIIVSENTIRNYIKKGLFKINQLDMIRPRFTALTTSKRRIIRNTELLAGRTYDDYLKYIKHNDAFIVQLDTVVGKLIDTKKILTIYWPSFHFQIGILLDKLTPSHVNNALLNLKSILGLSLYKKLFQTIITDNGIEFSLLDEIENDDNGEHLTDVFFCDPYNSSQKGACERNHEFIRYVLHKSTSFDNLTQSHIDLLFSHINSLPRKSLGFNSPYDIFKSTFGIKTLNLLNIKKINKDDIHLKPSLLK